MKNLYNDRVRVQIFGREYEMESGGLTPLEVQSVAGYVDEKMHEIATDLGIADTQKVAVLAALNIALDYIQLKEKGQTSGTDFTSQLEKLKKVLVTALEG